MAARKAKGKRIVRCSSLLYGARCLAAIATEEDVREEFSIPAQISNEGSRLGQAYHALQAFSQKHGHEKARDEVAAMARSWGTETRELGWLWSRLRVDSPVEFFDKIHVEEKFSTQIATGLWLEGSPDLVRIYNKFAALDVIDWKSGRLAISDDPDAYSHDQVISYTVLAVSRQKEGTIKQARAVVYPVRLGDRPTIYTMDVETLSKEADRIQQLAIDMDAQRSLPLKDRDYGLGIHCRFCDGRRTCPAYRKNMRSAVALMDEPIASGKGARTKNAARKEVITGRAEAIVASDPLKAYVYARLASELHESLKDAIKHDVEFWGNVDTGDGKSLGFKSYQAPASLTADYARQVITEVLSQRLDKRSDPTTISDLVDEIDERLRDRPMMDRRRLGHHNIE